MAREDLADARSAGAAYYRKIYDRVSTLGRIGVWECDLATDALSWTDMVYDLFDIPRGAPLDREDVLERYEPESRATLERVRAEAICKGTGFVCDVCIRTSAGAPRWIRITADIEREEGRPVRIFGTKQDVTEERAAQETVRALQRDLLHASQTAAMGTMASTLAHELNQPLTAIVNYMAAARRKAEGAGAADDLRACIAHAEETALRAGEIIRRLRAMTLSGRARRETFDLGAAAQASAALARSIHPHLQVEFAIPRSTYASGDRIQIEQVLLNLLHNADEAAGGGVCRVRIAALADAAAVTVSVADDGPGFPEGALSGVFDTAASTKAGGLGIGLSISRTIVEAHGGHITARNRPGGGAEVRFTLPQQAAESVAVRRG
ncbi:MAG TPA: HAMP domain-containing sensor histidine kinase [Allosphingosinicella sp.]|nr:HAMP domain-containing sensor histidine kinase [Allosphingosinicella sp.]